MNFSHKQQHEVVNNYYHQRKQQQKCLSTQKSYKKKQNKTGSINSKLDNDLMNSKYNSSKQIYILQKTDSQKGKEDNKSVTNILNNEKNNENTITNNTEKEDLNNKKNIDNTNQNDDSKKKRQEKHYQNNSKVRNNSTNTSSTGATTNNSTLNTSSAPVTPINNNNNYKKQDNSRRNKNNGNNNNTNNSNNRRYTKRDTYNNDDGIAKSNSRKSDEMTKSNSRSGFNKSDEMARTTSKNGYSKKDDKSNQRNNNNSKANNKSDNRGNGNKKNDSNRNNYYQRNSNQSSSNKREDGPGFAEKEYGLTYEKLKDNSSNDLDIATTKKHSYNSNVPSNPPILQRRRSSAPELPFLFEQLQSTDGNLMNNSTPLSTSISSTPSVTANPANLNFNLLNAAASASNTTPNFANFPLPINNLNGLNSLNLLNGFNLTLNGLGGINTFAPPSSTPTNTNTTNNNTLSLNTSTISNTNTNSTNSNSSNNNSNNNNNSNSNNNSTISGHGGRYNHLYAGPTFSNSPAASSLPMPNFINRNNSHDTSNQDAKSSSSRLSRSFAEEYMKLPSQLYSSSEINKELNKNYVADDLVLYSKNHKKDDFFLNNQSNSFNKEDLFMRRDIPTINTQNVVSGLSGIFGSNVSSTNNKRSSFKGIVRDNEQEVFSMDDEYSTATTTPNLPLANGMQPTSSSPTKTKVKSQEDENLKRKSMELLQYLSSSVAANSSNSSNPLSNDENQKVINNTNSNQTSAIPTIKIRSYNNSSTSSTSSSYTNTNTTLINSNEDNSMFSTTPNSYYTSANKNINSTLTPVISATTDVLSSSENSNSTLSLEQIRQNLKNMLKIN